MIIGDVDFADVSPLATDIMLERAWDRVFFTSDSHFGHGNILNWMKYSRQFDGAEEMDAALIEKWNATVGEDDIVFFLGDFTLGNNAQDYFHELNGEIYCCWLPQHHDKRWQKSKARYFGSSFVPHGFYESGQPLLSKSGRHVGMFAEGTVMRVRMFNNRTVNLTMMHFPLVEWSGSYYDDNWQLHGHTHGTYSPDQGHGFAYDVGADTNELAPVSLNELYNKGREWDLMRKKLQSYV